MERDRLNKEGGDLSISARWSIPTGSTTHLLHRPQFVQPKLQSRQRSPPHRPQFLPAQQSHSPPKAPPPLRCKPVFSLRPISEPLNPPYANNYAETPVGAAYNRISNWESCRKIQNSVVVSLEC
jgi:hypothetical protein